MIISRTPVRISFFGGGTDYKQYFSRNEGAVLGTTINKYIYISLNYLSDFFDHKIRVGYSKAELVNSIQEIEHPSVRECLKFKKIGGNLDIHIFADLPARSGLGSSSAFTVGFLHALYASEGKVVSKDQLAKDALYVEHEMLRENVGFQDQILAAYGGINIIRFSGSEYKVQPLIITREKRKLLESSLMVFYTGQTRLAHEVLHEQIERTQAKRNDEYLKEMYRMVDRAVKIISDEPEKHMLSALGKLMRQGWELKKSLSKQVSNQFIDQAYSRAVKAGAYGGKIAGAGGGGFLTFIVDPSKKSAVRKALKGLLEVDFKFEEEGSTIIYLKNNA